MVGGQLGYCIHIWSFEVDSVQFIHMVRKKSYLELILLFRSADCLELQSNFIIVEKLRVFVTGSWAGDNIWV